MLLGGRGLGPGVSDGAACAIIVPAERALRYTDTPMYVRALSLVAGSGRGCMHPNYDYTSFPEVVLRGVLHRDQATLSNGATGDQQNGGIAAQGLAAMQSR